MNEEERTLSAKMPKPQKVDLANFDDMVGEPPHFTYNKLVKGLKEKRFKKICFMTGAGISVSAGIPDFRSPGSGLFDNLQKYGLPYPEAIFNIDYFQESPQAFMSLAQTFLDLDKYQATPSHYFAKMVHDKKMMSYYLTQNIDNLESKAGFKPDDIVQAHGANIGAECSAKFCKRGADRKKLEKFIRAG